jgi:hypothetical protein
MRHLFQSRLVFAMILILSCTLTCRANWICCEGEEWLKWDAQTRNIYVRAYASGNMQGYAHGCSEGLVASSPKMTGLYTAGASKRCSAGAMITSRDSSHFAEEITKFYQSYPQQTFLRISDILLGLYAGKTLEQIHRSFPLK